MRVTVMLPGLWCLLGRINTVSHHQGSGGGSQAPHLSAGYTSKPLAPLWCQLELSGAVLASAWPCAAAGYQAPAPAPQRLEGTAGRTGPQVLGRVLSCKGHVAETWPPPGCRVLTHVPILPAPSPFLPLPGQAVLPLRCFAQGVPCLAGAGCRPWNMPPP